MGNVDAWKKTDRKTRKKVNDAVFRKEIIEDF